MMKIKRIVAKNKKIIFNLSRSKQLPGPSGAHNDTSPGLTAHLLNVDGVQMEPLETASKTRQLVSVRQGHSDQMSVVF